MLTLYVDDRLNEVYAHLEQVQLLLQGVLMRESVHDEPVEVPLQALYDDVKGMLQTLDHIPTV